MMRSVGVRLWIKRDTPGSLYAIIKETREARLYKFYMRYKWRRAGRLVFTERQRVLPSV